MITRTCRSILAASLSALLAAPSFAGSPGSTTGALLKIPVGTRAIGMGEAFTAMANDASTLYWNPAGLSILHQKEATFMHSSLIDSVHYEHLGFASPGDSFSWGTNLSYLGYGGITGYNETGVPTGDVSAYSYVFNGGISRLITDSISLGVSGGLIHETLSDTSANSFSANVGALYMLPSHPFDADYRFGASALNLGPGLKFISQRDPLPRRYKIGAAAENIRHLPLNLALDLTIPNDNKIYPSFGSEYWFKELIALRLGYAGSNDEGRGLRVGFGLRYAGVLFDYAYAGFGDLGATNRFSISMRFGEKIRQLNADERSILKEAKKYEKDGSYVQAILAYDELVDKDPTNDHVLHYMIKAHDRMAKATAETDVAEKSVPIPSPEDAAMAELVPDTPTIAQNTTPAGQIQPIGDDPLNLNRLPEVSAVDVGRVPPPRAAAMEAVPAPASNTPALSPTDIYGN